VEKMMDIASKTNALMEVIPYLQKFAGKIVVVKYGGNAMINGELKDSVLRDIAALKVLGLQPVLSHGGGPGINSMLEKLSIPVHFIKGLRYTSEDIMRVVEMVLIGQVNTELVGYLNELGVKAAGVSGVSGNLFRCHIRDEELGLVGDIDEVNPDVIFSLLDAGFVPVVAPVGTDGEGKTYNINGDTAAGKLAEALGAEKLILLTDIEGLCNDIKIRDVISYLNIADVPRLKERGIIAGGMIPKVDCCVEAINGGVGSVHIIDGRKPHSMLYEAFTNEGIGTTVGKSQPSVGIKA
jgi:acetylglutamate kinase